MSSPIHQGVFLIMMDIIGLIFFLLFQEIIETFVLDVVSRDPEDCREMDQQTESARVSSDVMDEILENIPTPASVQLILRALDNLYH